MTMDTTTALIALGEKFGHLKHAQHAFKTAFMAADEEQPPCWIPHIESDRRTALAAMTPLWQQDRAEFPESGICCAAITPERIDTIVDYAHALNRTKDDFQKAVTHFKQCVVPKGTKTKITRLMDQVLAQEGERDPHLAAQFKALGLSAIHLIWSYRKVHVLPKQLISIRWTWMKKHKEITRITLDQAFEMAAKLEDPYTRDSIEKQLSKENPNHPLAYIKPIKPQLRANLVWKEDGEKMRKTIITPTVLLSQDPSLPIIKWPVDPEVAPKREARSDKKIEEDPIILALHLYRYLPHALEEMQSEQS